MSAEQKNLEQSVCRIEVNVSLDDYRAGECADHRALMRERVAGTLAFQRLDAALYEPIRLLVNRRLHCPDRFTQRDQGRLDGLTEARRALWDGRSRLSERTVD